jgi:microcystin-dependent protein
MTIEAPPLWLQGGTYPARIDRMQLAQQWDEGVLSATSCKVTQRGAGANFSVDVAIGDFIIGGDDQSLQGSYMGRVTATENAVIGAAPGSNSRYDLVTLRVNDPNAGGNAGNTVTVVVVAGTAASSPVVPALPASSIPIAIVGPIATATPSITTSLIHDAHTGTGPTAATATLPRGVGDVRLLAGLKDTPGILKDFAGSSDWIPNGWLIAAGQAVSRTTYASLFAMLSTTYGVGDGATTFNLPDLRGRVPFGLDNMNGTDAGRLTASNTLGGSGGDERVTAAAMPTHTHSTPAHSHAIDHNHAAYSETNLLAEQTIFVTAGAGTGVIGISPGNATIDIPAFTGSTPSDGASTTGSAGSGTAGGNLPPYLLVNKMIRT